MSRACLSVASTLGALYPQVIRMDHEVAYRNHLVLLTRIRGDLPSCPYTLCVVLRQGDNLAFAKCTSWL
jgi:hypothetical protein